MPKRGDNVSYEKDGNCVHSGHRQRLKSRFTADGLKSFNEINTLELLLFYSIPRRDTNELAHRLLSRFGSLSGVLNASAAELSQVDGIAEQSAILIRLVSEIAHLYLSGDNTRKRFTDTDGLGAYIASQFIGLERETVMVFGLDASNMLKSRKILFCGGFRDAKISASRLSRFALSCGADYIVLAHNHPGGSLMPSEADMIATRRLCKALQAVDVRLAEHFIVASGKFVQIMNNSSSENGYLSLDFFEGEE